jgi:uncharacterized FlaG/YvyC family protein
MLSLKANKTINNRNTKALCKTCKISELNQHVIHQEENSSKKVNKRSKKSLRTGFKKIKACWLNYNTKVHFSFKESVSHNLGTKPFNKVPLTKKEKKLRTSLNII